MIDFSASTLMTIDDIRGIPDYRVFNILDYIDDVISFDVEIVEGFYKNTVISFNHNTKVGRLYKYSFTNVIYKGKEVNSVLYENDLTNICSNILLKTLL